MDSNPVDMGGKSKVELTEAEAKEAYDQVYRTSYMFSFVYLFVYTFFVYLFIPS